jgi:hypothetical protein
MGGVPKPSGGPLNFIKDAVTLPFMAPILATKALYKATDPLGTEAARKAAKGQAEDTQRKQDAAAAAQAEAIRTAPKTMGRQTLTAQDRRFRSGLSANIRAANLGPAPLAPAAATGKPKLGQ